MLRLGTSIFSSVVRPTVVRPVNSLLSWWSRGGTVCNISYLGQDQSKAIDDELMGPMGFSVDQLMELAGLSVACVVHKQYPVPRHNAVVVICGPGNNGGDGLVAARHLKHFGYTPSVYYPKRTDKQLYKNLVMQCEGLAIPMLADLPNLTKFHVIIDAIFGFSFKGAIKPPFDMIIEKMKTAGVPVVSVDIPSGWDVELGDTSPSKTGLKCDTLVSLTAPKKCAQNFTGHHYLGGRFIAPAFAAKHNIVLPVYPGTDQCVKLS